MECECTIGLVTLVVAIAGFVVTYIALKQGTNTLKISNVIELKKIFHEYSDINSKLLPDGEWNQPNFDFKKISVEQFSDFNSYLGYFEVAKLMIEKNLLTKKEFETFFLYRLSNISNCEPVMKNIKKNQDSWGGLLNLIEMFKS